MSQIALPLKAGQGGPRHIALGTDNRAVLEALQVAPGWPFRTAVLSGPPRSGKSLIARFFAESGAGEAIDDADRMDETELFHRWNRAQEAAKPLLLVRSSAPGDWRIALPDLASRIGAALALTIGTPDDEQLAQLIAVHAENRALALGPDAAEYLVPRLERTHVAVERLVETIDRLSLERKAAPTLGIWRDALEAEQGPAEPRLL
ncbi:MAG: ATPase [Novosphingobium sp.]